MCHFFFYQGARQKEINPGGLGRRNEIEKFANRKLDSEPYRPTRHVTMSRNFWEVKLGTRAGVSVSRCARGS